MLFARGTCMHLHWPNKQLLECGEASHTIQASYGLQAISRKFTWSLISSSASESLHCRYDSIACSHLESR